MTDASAIGPEELDGVEVRSEVRRLRAEAERVWDIATEHRTLATELESGAELDAYHRAKTQRMLGEVAAHQGFAYHELANAAEARADARTRPRESPEWKLRVDRAFAAIRRAEAHHERAAAYSARIAGDEAIAREHESAARDAGLRAMSLDREKQSA